MKFLLVIYILPSAVAFHLSRHFMWLSSRKQVYARTRSSLLISITSNNNDSSLPVLSQFSGSLLAPINIENSNITIARIPTDSSFSWDQDVDSSQKAPISPYERDQNRYYKLVADLAPHDMLLKFSQSAPRNVQEAVKSTIVSILGSMPSFALDAVMITTNSKLASLMFQMQITGYMYKNAEYRMSMTRSLKGLPRLPLPQTVTASPTNSNATLVIRAADPELSVSGRVSVTDSSGNTGELAASALMAALSAEVEQLRAELTLLREQREPELQANLLTYIQALPERELGALTSGISTEVMDAINLLVQSLMTRMGVPPPGGERSEALIQQSVGALAQLCMWQLVIGYRLRELEVLEKGIDL